MTASYTMPVRLAVEWKLAETDVVPGVRIALRAEIVLAPVEVHLFLRTPGTGPEGPVEGAPLRVNLFGPDTRVLRHERRMVQSPGAQGLSVRVTDSAGQPLSDEFTLGPRDSNWRRAELAFPASVEATAWVVPPAATASGRTRLMVRGELVFTGGVWLQWSARPARGAAQERGSVPPRMQLATTGAPVSARERVLEQACPAEAWVSAELVDGSGKALTERTLLGRYLPS